MGYTATDIGTMGFVGESTEDGSFGVEIVALARAAQLLLYVGEHLTASSHRVAFAHEGNQSDAVGIMVKD